MSSQHLSCIYYMWYLQLWPYLLFLKIFFNMNSVWILGRREITFRSQQQAGTETWWWTLQGVKATVYKISSSLQLPVAFWKCLLVPAMHLVLSIKFTASWPKHTPFLTGIQPWWTLLNRLEKSQIRKFDSLWKPQWTNAGDTPQVGTVLGSS